MKDTCKQAIFRKDTRRAKRVEDLWTAGDQDKGELEFFNRGTKQDTRYKSNQNAYQLLGFKKSIKREVSQYTVLKDEKYFEAFKRNLLVTATTHDCEEI